MDYLHDLGITDCYASSYLRAVPDSPHGYDVADPTRLNPQIGTDQEYWDWIEAMHARGMGQLMDLVPNHMGIAKSANPWWLDVLENGPSSRFARFFDIEWHPVKAELADKILIPILGDQYGAVLERQELQLVYGEGAFFIRYHDRTLPIATDTFGAILEPDIEGWATEHAGEEVDELQSILTAARNLPPRSDRDRDAIVVRAREKEIVKRRLAALERDWPAVAALIAGSVKRMNGVAGQPRTFDALDGLLNMQSYRLAHWRVASEEINYRRFFDVNELAALRMEDPEVFDEVHRFAFELVKRGAVTGLRIDHVDGLFAPRDYLSRLQERCAGTEPFFIVVEKILGPGEQLPSDWPVHGTTGYEFAATVNNLFVDRRNERAFDDLYRRIVRERRLSFRDLAYRCKKQVLHETMSGDINSLGHQLNRFSERKQARVKNLIERYDMVAVLVATLLPPPFPFKLFVVTAGVFRFSLVRFMLAIIVGRGFRFLLEGYFAVRYGAEAKAILAKYYPWIGLGLVVGIVLFVFVKRWIRRGTDEIEHTLEAGN